LKLLIAGVIIDPKWRGGEPLVAKLLARGLADRGIEVVTYGKERQSVLKPLNLLSHHDINPIIYKFYLKLLSVHKPDIVLGFYDYDCSLVFACLKLKIPIVVCVQIYWPVCPLLTLFVEKQGVCEGPSLTRCISHMLMSYTGLAKFNKLSKSMFTYLKFLSRLHILNKANAIVVPSYFVKKKLSSYGLRNIHVIWNSVDLNDIQYKEWSDDRKLILNPSGYIDERKGFPHFLIVAKTLGRRLRQVKFFAAGYKGDEYVEGLGYLNRSELIRLLEESYLVVIPSLWDEPFGLVVTEAMAAGRPVVAYKSGGIPEIVIDGVTGILVPRGDVKALISAVEYLIEHEEIARRMGREGRKRVEKYFSAEQMVRKYYDLLKDVLNGGA